MLFVVEYELEWDQLDAAMAKRLDWDAVQPDDFQFVGEYIWQDIEPPFRGVAILEAGSVEAVNAFILHYGPSLRMSARPASDVLSAITTLGAASPPPTPAAKRGRKKRR